MADPTSLRRLLGWVQDRPGRVSATLAAGVGLQAVLAHWWLPSASVGRLLGNASAGDRSVLFLGAASAAAMVAGFAGIIVVFALSSGSERFRTFRVQGSSPLRANWTSCMVAGLTSGLFAIISSILTLSERHFWGWTFELSLLFLAHGALRLVWMLRVLARIVDAEDRDVLEAEEQVSLKEVWRGRNVS